MSEAIITKQEEYEGLRTAKKRVIETMVELSIQVDVLESDRIVIKSDEHAQAIEKAMYQTKLQLEAQTKALRMIKAKIEQLEKDLGLVKISVKV